MNKKINWVITTLTSIMLLVLVVGSFINSLLIYVSILYLGVLALISMVRIDLLNLRLIKSTKEEEVKETEPKEIKKEQMDAPPTPPFDDIISLVKQYKEEGYTKEEIEEGLKEKYDKFVVDFVMKYVGGK